MEVSRVISDTDLVTWTIRIDSVSSWKGYRNKSFGLFNPRRSRPRTKGYLVSITINRFSGYRSVKSGFSFLPLYKYTFPGGIINVLLGAKQIRDYRRLNI